jgi:hypothetical protein
MDCPVLISYAGASQVSRNPLKVSPSNHPHRLLQDFGPGFFLMTEMDCPEMTVMNCHVLVSWVIASLACLPCLAFIFQNLNDLSLPALLFTGRFSLPVLKCGTPICLNQI